MVWHQISNSVGNYNYNAFIYTDTVWQPHFHGNYELIYTIDGVTQISVNGVAEKLEKGYFVLVSPYTTHSLNISENASTWVGVFSKDYIPDFARKYHLVNFSKFKIDKEFEAFLQKNLLHDEKAEHYLLEACLYIVCGQCVKNAKARASQNDNEFVKNVIIYITQNIEKNITMQMACNELNYEYHYFSALFHKYFSMNFKNFVNVLRFEQACEMLSKNECDITEVCNLCGFASIRNFNRVFKKFSGITPSRYKSEFKC